MVAMLLATYVVAALARAAQPTTTGRLVLLLGVGYLLLLPPAAWAVLYLLPLWLAAAAVSLARR